MLIFTHVAGVGGVDELAAAEVDAHVTEPMEEDQVSGVELIGGHRGKAFKKATV